MLIPNVLYLTTSMYLFLNKLRVLYTICCISINNLKRAALSSYF